MKLLGSRKRQAAIESVTRIFNGQPRNIKPGPVDLWVIPVDIDERPLACERMSIPSWEWRQGTLIMLFKPVTTKVLFPGRPHKMCVCAVNQDQSGWARQYTTNINGQTTYWNAGEVVTIEDLHIIMHIK